LKLWIDQNLATSVKLLRESTWQVLLRCTAVTGQVIVAMGFFLDLALIAVGEI